jgi:uncharacterized protein (TIGR00369 family)
MRNLPPPPAPAEHSFEAWQQWFEAFKDRTAVGFHGIELVSVDDDGLILRMEVGPHALQPYGLLHGGMNMLLIESAASLHSCWKIDLSTRVPVGIEINGSHLRSSTGGTVLAAATQIRRSRTIAHHEVTITQEETGKTISVGRMTNLYVDV